MEKVKLGKVDPNQILQEIGSENAALFTQTAQVSSSNNLNSH